MVGVGSLLIHVNVTLAAAGRPLRYFLFDRAHAKGMLNHAWETCTRAGLTVGDLYTLMLSFPAVLRRDIDATVVAYVSGRVGHERPAVVSAVPQRESLTDIEDDW
jgi:hypothetical protein